MRVRSFEELEKDVGKLTEFRAPPPPPRHRGGLLSFFLPSAAAEDASAGYSSSSDDDGTDASSSLPAAAEKSPQNPPLPPPLPPPPRDRYWMRDSLYAACADCGQPFTAWTRRHHCRCCGVVFCARCCPKNTRGVRVCGDCSAADLPLTQQPKPWERPQTQQQFSGAALQLDAALLQQCDAFFQRIVGEIVGAQGLSVREWAPIVSELAGTAALRVRPRAIDSRDVREYVRIKVVPSSGSASDGDAEVLQSVYVDALAFGRKHTAHRAMRCAFASPSILLLGCPIDYVREARLVGLEELFARERDYLMLLVNRIAAEKPDVIFVQGLVCRVAIDLFVEAGITVFANVKPRLMRRIARYTGAEILSSLNVVRGDGSSKQYLGWCRSLRAESYDIGSPDGAPKTVFFLEGEPGIGGSIILRGARPPILEEVKRALHFSIFAAYALRSERAFTLEETLHRDEDEGGVVQRMESFQAQMEEELSRRSSLSFSLRTHFPKRVSPVADIVIASRHARMAASARHVSILFPPCLTPSLESPHYLRMFRDDNGVLRVLYTPTAIVLSLPSDCAPARRRQFDIVHEARHYQSLLVVHSLAPRDPQTGYQCMPFEAVKYDFYSPNERSLGQFLEGCCFKSTQRCPNQSCWSTIPEHERTFLHHQSRVNVIVDNIELPRVQEVLEAFGFSQDALKVPSRSADDSADDEAIAAEAAVQHWRWCRRCNKFTAPVRLSSEAWNLSFGKFLESLFYGIDHPLLRICEHSTIEHTVCFFKSPHFVQFDRSPIVLYDVVTPSIHPPVRDAQGLSESCNAFLDTILADVLNCAEAVFDNIDKQISAIQSRSPPPSLLSPAAAAAAAEQQDSKLTPEQLVLLRQAFQIDRDRLTKAITSWTRDCGVLELSGIKRELHLIHSAWLSRLHEASSDLLESSAESRGSLISRLPALLRRRSLLTSSRGSTPFSPGGVLPTADVSPVPSDLSASTSDVLEHGSSVSDALAFATQLMSGVSASTTPQPQQTSDHATRSNPVRVPFAKDSRPTQEKGEIYLPSLGPRKLPVVVYENEPSTVAAYALASSSYATKFLAADYDSARGRDKDDEDSQDPRAQGAAEEPAGVDKPIEELLENQTPEAFLSMLGSGERTDITAYFAQKEEGGRATVSCTVHFARQFYALRRLCWNEERDDTHFVHSLSRSRGWHAMGGKSRSRFEKTWDDRFVCKQLPSVELGCFTECAPKYFEYFRRVFSEGVSTQLSKIFGVFTVRVKTASASFKYSFLVMENLLCGREVSTVYDLKGALRGRFVTDPTGVLLDGNLCRSKHSAPLCMRDAAKQRLWATVANDSKFLACSELMDYSLLVGVDVSRGQLVTGIIDYVRGYTWDKQVETLLKTRAYNVKPTIISPAEYRQRFMSAIWSYFVLVPDRFSGIPPSVTELS